MNTKEVQRQAKLISAAEEYVAWLKESDDHSAEYVACYLWNVVKAAGFSSLRSATELPDGNSLIVFQLYDEMEPAR